MSDPHPPNHRLMTPLQGLAEQVDGALRDEPGATASLRATLEANPALWNVLGNLAARAERAWIGLAVGPDPVAAEALQRQLDTLRVELAGPAPSPIVRLLADQATVGWLQTAYCDAAVAQAPKAGRKLSELLMKRQDLAQRRYLAALRMLSDVQRLTETTTRRRRPLTVLDKPGAVEPKGEAPMSKPTVKLRMVI